jgi:hypothetical protein
LQRASQLLTLIPMFSIEHEFDATVITLVDEGTAYLQEDVIINAFTECITLEQFNPREGRAEKITLSTAQIKELVAALDLPEGVYRLNSDQTPKTE